MKRISFPDSDASPFTFHEAKTASGSWKSGRSGVDGVSLASRESSADDLEEFQRNHHGRHIIVTLMST
ncbi:MAG: hypothetical protein IPM58_01790 [Nitrospira sp.]|nr:hypothetical protein [Nitrospira sp.]